MKPILKCLYAACAFFVLLELVFLFGWADKEAHYGWENMVGFYAAYGFVSCVAAGVRRQVPASAGRDPGRGLLRPAVQEP